MISFYTFVFDELICTAQKKKKKKIKKSKRSTTKTVGLSIIMFHFINSYWAYMFFIQIAQVNL